MAKPPAPAETVAFPGRRLHRIAVGLQWPTAAKGPLGNIGRDLSMKSFWIGASVAIIIAVVAGIGLNATGQSTAQKFSTPEARLSKGH